MQHKQRTPDAVASLGVFQHLPVAGRVAKGDDRAAGQSSYECLVIIIQ
jgi:hypothetical protein